MNESTTENSILKFLTVSSVSSDSIVKGIIDDIVNTAVKTAEKNVLLCTRLYKYAPNLGSFLTQQYVCVMCTL
jgi:hypothetical protein